MLNSIGLQGPGIDGLIESTLPRLATLGIPVLGVGRRASPRPTSPSRAHGSTTVTTSRRSSSISPARTSRRRPRRRRELVAAARAATDEAAVRQAVTRDLGHRALGARRRRRRCRRPLARQHDPRSRARPGDAPTAARPRRRRVLRPGAETDRPGVRPRVRDGGRSSRSSAWVGSRPVRTLSSSSQSVRARSRSERSCSPIPMLPVASEASWTRLPQRPVGSRTRTLHTGSPLSDQKNPCKSRKTVLLDRGRDPARLVRLMVTSKTQAQAPARSLDQRMEALQRANDIRVGGLS